MSCYCRWPVEAAAATPYNRQTVAFDFDTHHLHAPRTAAQSLLAVPALAATLLALVACATSTGGADSQVGTNGLLTVSDLAVGVNRFAFTLLTPDGVPLDGAEVHVRFFQLFPDRDEYRSEAAATFRPFTGIEPHRHADGTAHPHGIRDGFYVVDPVTFDTAGVWQARFEIRSACPSVPDTGTLAFEVAPRPSTPGIGDPAPRSNNPSVRDVADLVEITTHQAPVRALYESTVAEAIDRGEPVVVAFSTPAFCLTAVCGPVTDVVMAVYKEYGQRASFIHIEPWDLTIARTEGRLVWTDAAREWSLPSEPWVFVVDTGGRVAARFEGLVSSVELAAALDAVLGSPS